MKMKSSVFLLFLLVHGVIQIRATPLDHDYAGINNWNPCNVDWWVLEDFKYPMYPLSRGAPNSNVVPGTEHSLFEEMCSETVLENGDYAYALSHGWRTYQRSLFPGDAFIAKPPIEESDPVIAPYFSLYNVNTGVLRTFIYTSADFTTGGHKLMSQTSVIDPNGNKVPHGLGGIDNGLPYALSMGESAFEYPSTWIAINPTARKHSFWLVTEQTLTYDPWLVGEGNLPTEKFMKIGLIDKNVANLTLKGTITTSTQSEFEGGVGFFQDNPILASVVTGAMTKSNGTLIAKKLNTQLFPSESKTDAASLSAAGTAQSASPWVTAASGIIDWGLPAGLPALSGFVESALMGRKVTYTTSNVSLEGTLEENTAVNTANLPISTNSLKWRPFYSRRVDGEDPINTDLGLYNLYTPPKLYVRRKETYAQEKTLQWSSGTQDHWGYDIFWEYYVGMEDPLCDLAVNPSAQSSLHSVLAIPVVWNASTQSWKTMGNLQDKKSSGEWNNLSFWHKKKIGYREWHDIAMYWKYHRNSDDMSTESNANYGVDLTVQFKDQPEDVSGTPQTAKIVRQKTYRADVDFVIFDDDFETYRPKIDVCAVQNNHIARNPKFRGFGYGIKVVTGDGGNRGGTNSHISLRLIGCDNLSETFILDNSENNFEQNATDRFVRFSPISHGAITQLQFISSNTGTKPGWLLSSFDISELDLKTGKILNGNRDNTTNPLMASPNIWLSDDELKGPVSKDVDGNIVYTYNVPGAKTRCQTEKAVEPPLPSNAASYIVSIETPNIKNAETAASLAIVVCGVGSDGVPFCLPQQTVSGLQKNSSKQITINDKLMKEIRSVSIQHLDSSDPWYGGDIAVTEKNSDGDVVLNKIFPVRKWVAALTIIKREAGKGVAYELVVTTSSAKYAGTDANIHARLCGVSACVDFDLDNETMDDNESGATSTFKYYSETNAVAGLLSESKTLTLYNDDHGGYSGWKIDRVNLKSIDLSQASPTVVNDWFYFDQWLASGKMADALDGGAITTQIDLNFINGGSASVSSGYYASRKANSSLEFDLTIKTGVDDRAGTSSKVWAKIGTCGGDNYEFYLNNRGNDFENSDKNYYHRFRNIVSPDKDNRIASIALAHDNSEDHPGWLVDNVQLEIKNADDPSSSISSYDVTWNHWVGENEEGNILIPISLDPNRTYYGVKMDKTCGTLSRKVRNLAKVSAQYRQGEEVLIEGDFLASGITNGWTATLQGKTVPIHVASDAQLRIEIPKTFTPGIGKQLEVANTAAGISWTSTIEVVGPDPIVTVQSHLSRKAGEYFELLGSNFGRDETNIVVKVATVTAPLVRLQNDRVSVMIPKMAAGTYTVSVLIGGRLAAGSVELTILPSAPSIQRVSPNTVSPGGVLSIWGSGFGQDAAVVVVSIGTVSVTPLTVTDGLITIEIPSTLTSGKYEVSVTVLGINSPEVIDVDIIKMPIFMSFDNPTQVWYSNETTVSRDPTKVSTNSTASLAIHGENYRVIRSPRFNTTDFGKFSDKLALDLFIPATVSNPNWLGEVTLFIDIPAAGVNNAWQSKVDLTGKTVGRWHTLYFPINSQTLQAIAGDYPNMEIAIVLNAASATEPYRIDELRFVDPNLQYRTVQHVKGSRHLNVVVPAKLGFEESDPWQVPGIAAAQYVTEPREEGATAMQVNAAGFMHLLSPELRAFELSIATKDVNVDVHVPDPQPNQWWVGNIGAYVDCPFDGIYNQPIGQKDLTHLFRMEYNTVRFEIPATLLPRIKSSIGGCRFFVDMNVTNGPAPFILDKMGFVHPDGEVVVIPAEPPASSSSSNAGSSSSSSPSSSSAGFACTAMCADAIIATTQYNPYSLGTTSEVWYVMNRIPQGWQANEMAGRTISVNGVTVTAGQTNWPAAVNGKWYIQFSPGAHSWASWSWW